MNNVLADPDIPDDARVAIEYQIPRSSKRVDFLLSGQRRARPRERRHRRAQAVVAGRADRDGRGRPRPLPLRLGRHGHPSYQAWSYAALLKGFNATVYEEDIGLRPCAYLPQLRPGSQRPSRSSTTRPTASTSAGPRSSSGPTPLRLRAFIKRYVRHGDDGDVIYRIEHGQIRPSKSLADALASMLRGNEEFVMIDEQKVVYERALALADRADVNNKHVLIVEGGPGTGKSVVAVNLLVALTGRGKVAQYVTKNAAPRAVYESRLTGSYTKSAISNLFTGSGAFRGSEVGDFDVLVVDEAHRLNEKSGLYKNLGENQIKEIVRAANLAVFFLDEDQRVTFDDIGEWAEIERWAERGRAPSCTGSSCPRSSGATGPTGTSRGSTTRSRSGRRRTRRSTPDAFDFRVVDSPGRAAGPDPGAERGEQGADGGRVLLGLGEQEGRCRRTTSSSPSTGSRTSGTSTKDGSLWIEIAGLGRRGRVHPHVPGARARLRRRDRRARTSASATARWSPMPGERAT